MHSLSGLRALRHYSGSEASHTLTENVKSRKLNLRDVLCILPQIFPIEPEVEVHRGACSLKTRPAHRFFIIPALDLRKNALLFFFLSFFPLSSLQRGQPPASDPGPAGSKHPDQLAVFHHHGRQSIHPPVWLLGQELPGLLHRLGYDRNPDLQYIIKHSLKLLSWNFSKHYF